MISLTNHDFQWGHSEVVIIYPDGLILTSLSMTHEDKKTRWSVHWQETCRKAAVTMKLWISDFEH